MRRTVLWILAAVAGVLVVAGVTAAASTLSTQTIGLSSEPLTAGDALAPKAKATPTATRRKAAAKPKPKPKPTKRRRPSDDNGAASGTPTASGTPSISGGDDHGGSAGGVHGGAGRVSPRS